MASSNLVVADAMSAVFNGSWAGKLLVMAGIGGIITSWNSFYIGGSRAIYALAHAKMLPSFLAKLHPKHNTPYNAILLIGFFSCLAPLFGREAMVWLVDAGGFAIIIAYAMVAISFLILRKREPEMKRPFRVAKGYIVGTLALVFSIAIALLYLPDSPAALVPAEWIIVGSWSVLGLAMYIPCRLRSHNETKHIIEYESQIDRS